MSVCRRGECSGRRVSWCSAVAVAFSRSREEEEDEEEEDEEEEYEEEEEEYEELAAVVAGSYSTSGFGRPASWCRRGLR
jgi:hypothetical protein